MSKKKAKGDEVKNHTDHAPEENSQHMTDALNNAMLRETIEKLEDQKVKLLLNIKSLVDKLTQQKQDQSDIYYYLNKKLDDNYEVIAALEDQILTEQGDRENAEKAFEKRFEDTAKEHHKEVHGLQTRILDLEEKLQILKQFSSEKETLDENLKELLDTLENERKQYRIYTEDMERKAALDREKVKHDFEQQILQYRADIQKKVDSKLSKAVKNTRAVNECMQQELKYQSNTVQNMLKLTDTILDKDKNLRVELSIAQSNEGEIAHRLATYQRIIKQLNGRIAHEEEEKALIKSSFENLLQSKEEEAKKAREEVAHLHAFIDKENRQLDEVWKALSETYAQVQVKKKRQNRPTDEPADHDEVLCEVFYRLVKKNPLKFKSLFRGRMRSSLSTAGSDVMSTNSSKDSLLFPKINSARGSMGGIPASIDFSLESQSKPSVFNEQSTQKQRFPGRLVDPTKITDTDSEAGSGRGSPTSKQFGFGSGSSVATGIPAWDRGVAKAAQEANWWLNSESQDTDYIAAPESAGDAFDLQDESASVQIGFAENSLASNTAAATIGGDLNVLSSLCEPKPETSLKQTGASSEQRRVVCKDASAQTEGRVSVFPPGSVWSQSQLVSASNSATSSPRGALGAMRTDSSLRALSNRMQGVSTPDVPPPVAILSPGKDKKNKMTPQPPAPGLNVHAFENSPIKTMMANLPGYQKHGNSKETLVKKREQQRRVLHGRRITPSGGNSKELDYTRREVTSGESMRSSSQGSASRLAPASQSIYGRNSGINNGYLSDEDSQNGFSICGSSVASTLQPPLGSPESSVGSYSVSTKTQRVPKKRIIKQPSGRGSNPENGAV
jgi:hypothetical protein